jgi:hypothetical protein
LLPRSHASIPQRRHTALTIQDELAAIANKWGLQNKIAGATTDNADNMVNAIKALGWPHVPCVAHTLNLVLEHAILQCDQLKSIVKKARKLVKRVRKSSSVLSIALEDVIKEINQRRDKAVKDAVLAAKAAEDAASRAKAVGDASAAALDAAATQARQSAEVVKETNLQLPVKLKQCVKTRWNSLYFMLERLLVLRAPLITMLASHTGDGPAQVRCLFPVFFSALSFIFLLS